MARPCEICEGLSASTGALVPSRNGRLRRVLFGERIVALCDEHAKEVRSKDIQSLEELHQSYLEPFPGQRSLIDRRAPMDRRVFPARPEGRRHDGGRRATDSRE